MNELKLGKVVPIPEEPSASIIDAVPAPPGEYVVRFTIPEMTSLCPATGAPDFATLVIDYVPDKLLVESKSLKLYINSYRNHRGFHEACTAQIGRDITDVIKPTYIRVGAFWYPRGGIPIDVFWQSGVIPACVWMPDQGVSPYRGR